MPSLMLRRCLRPVVAAPLLLLAACGGGGGSVSGPVAPPGPPTLRFTGMTVSGQTNEAATVTVHAAADQDGAADGQFRVALALDGDSAATSLPTDTGPGAPRDLPLPIVARDPSDNTTTVSLSAQLDSP